MGFEWPWQRDDAGRTHLSVVTGRVVATGGQNAVNYAYDASGAIISPFFALGEAANRAFGGEPGTFNVFRARNPRRIRGSYAPPFSKGQLVTGVPQGGATGAGEPTSATRALSIVDTRRRRLQFPVVNRYTVPAVREQAGRIDLPEFKVDVPGAALVAVGLAALLVLTVALGQRKGASS